MDSSLVPIVVEKTARGERSYDIYSRLLKDRIIFLGGAVTEDLATTIVAQMLFLQLQGDKEEINLYIMSPGGSVTSGLAIYDTMQHISCDVATFCIGQAASMGAFLLAAGTKGKRHALPSSRIMIHQPWGGAHGDAVDLEIQAKEITTLKKMLNRRLATHTGKTLKQLEKDCDRDHYLSAEEAKDYGLIDTILNK